MLELIDSLTSWLNDIWSVVYEYHDNYNLAHRCLSLTMEVLSSFIDTSPGSGSVDFSSSYDML